MDRKWKSGAAVSPPALDNASDGYATAGNPGTGTPATKPGPHWYHMTTEELISLILAGGITPDKTDVTQVLASVQAMLSGGAVVNGKVVVTASAVSHTWTIALKTLAGADPSVTTPIFVAFRHPTASDGSRVMRKITGALSMVISSGSTLGHTSGTNQDVFIYLIDNAGTVELAVSKVSSGTDGTFGSTRLVTTTAEGGAGAADSGTAVYSTTARVNVPWASVARAISNQVTAGTWDAGPVVTDMAPFSQSVALASSTPAAVTLVGSAGASATAARSDHVHALDVSIVPTLSGAWTFTKLGAYNDPTLHLNSNLPYFQMQQANGTANQRVWARFAQGGLLREQIVNDAGSIANSWVDVTGGAAATIAKVAFPATANVSFSVGADDGVTNYGGGNSWGAQVRANGGRAGMRVAVSSATNAADPVQYLHHEATTGNNTFASFVTEASAGRGSITYNRGANLTAFNTTSDARLKENIRDSEGALSVVMEIKIRAFDWRHEPGSALRYWVVAQELAEVMPEAVTIPEDPEQIGWSVDPSKLVPLAIKAVQEQQADLQGLHAQVLQLLARVQALEAVGSKV